MVRVHEFTFGGGVDLPPGSFIIVPFPRSASERLGTPEGQGIEVGPQRDHAESQEQTHSSWNWEQGLGHLVPVKLRTASRVSRTVSPKVANWVAETAELRALALMWTL